MADKETKAPQALECVPSVENQISALASANAPFVFFENAHLSAVSDGAICAVTLTASRPIGARADGTSVSDHVVTANLRGGLASMLKLRDQINTMEELVNRMANQAIASVPDVPATMQ